MIQYFELEKYSGSKIFWGVIGIIMGIIFILAFSFNIDFFTNNTSIDFPWSYTVSTFADFILGAVCLVSGIACISTSEYTEEIEIQTRGRK